MREHITRPALAIGFLASLLLVTCARKEKHTGSVGNYFSISVKAPWGVDSPVFEWQIVAIPDRSQLSFSDLIIAEDGAEMTFQPDEPGDYEFDVVVYDESGEKSASQSYQFVIAAALPVVQREVAEAKEKEVSEERLRDTIPPASMVSDTAQPKTTQQEYALTEEKDTTHISSEAGTQERAEEAVSELSEREEAVVVRKRPEKLPPKTEPERGRKIPRMRGKYAIQVSSWATLEEAESQAEGFLDLGLDAYVQRARFEETGEVWYRVRIGTFSDYASASVAAAEVSSIINVSTWVDNVRIEPGED